MDAIVPLVLLWALANRRDDGGGGGQASSRAPSQPNWPTTRSPPPPMPAFTPFVPEPAAQPATPLATLHQRALNAPKPRAAPKPASPVTQAKRAATAAAKKAASSAFSSVTKGFSLRDVMPSSLSRGTPTVNKTVSDIQAVVNSHGGALRRDGLYGPKTASAWAALARQNGLPTDIKRVGPKVAAVAIHTFDALSVPPIP